MKDEVMIVLISVGISLIIIGIGYLIPHFLK